MSRQLLQDTQPGFQGGLNLTADPSALGQNELRRADNAQLTETGGTTRRTGLRRLHATALGAGAAVKAGYNWIRITGNTLVAVSNGTVYTASYAVPATWASLGAVLDATVYPSIAQFRDLSTTNVLYLADGGPLNKYDGTTFTANIASSPNLAGVCVYNSRLYGFDGTTATLYYSDLDNGDSCGISGSGGGSVIIATAGRQRVTGLCVVGGSLMIFHERSISRWTGVSLDDVEIKVGTAGLSNDTGTIAQNSIVVVENVAYFATDRGFYSLTENGVSPVGEAKIDSVLTVMSAAALAGVRGAHDRANRQVFFYTPDTGIYVYNYRQRSFSGPWTGAYISPVTTAIFQATDASGLSIVCTGGNDGFVRQANFPSQYIDDVLSDGTGRATYGFVIQLHRMFFTDPAAMKSLRAVQILANLRGSTSPQVSWTTDQDTNVKAIASSSSSRYWNAGGTWNSANPWPLSLARTVRVLANGLGQYVDVTISDDGQSNALYSSVTVDAYMMGRR